MAIGNQPDVGGLNTSLGDCAVTMRDAAAQVMKLWAFVQAEGTAGLEAVGFTPGDATDYFNAMNYLQTVAGVYFGTATQGSQFNFDSALAKVRGGG